MALARSLHPPKGRNTQPQHRIVSGKTRFYCMSVGIPTTANWHFSQGENVKFMGIYCSYENR